MSGKDIVYQYPAEKGVRPVTETVEFIQIVTKEKMDYFTDAQKEVLFSFIQELNLLIEILFFNVAI